MSSVLDTLKAHNECLFKLLTSSQDFIKAEKTPENFVPQLDLYEKKRGILFKALHHYQTTLDRLANEKTNDAKNQRSSINSSSPFDDSMLAEIKHQLEIREQTTRAILDLDRSVLTQIENERTRLQKELSGSTKNSSQLKKFKSAWVNPSGEKLDGQV